MAGKRFRISDYEGVEWDNLHPDSKAEILEDSEEISMSSQQGFDTHTYTIKKTPFRIEYYINNTLLMETNSDDMMYFERKLPSSEQE